MGLTLAIAASCGSGGSGAETTSTETTTTTTAPASPVTTASKPGMSADEVAVRNVLDLEAAEFGFASDPPDPDRPGLREYNAGAALEKRLEIVNRLRDNGEYSRRPGGGVVPHKTDVVDFESPTVAIAYECYIDDRVRRKVATDELVNDTVASIRLRTRIVREDDGVWRISSREQLESYRNANACPDVQR